MSNSRLFFKNAIPIILLIFLLLGLSSCMQGSLSENPPIHINPNMDKQEKYKANEQSRFFQNGSVNRMPVEGAVARSELYDDVEFFFGVDAQGDTLAKNYFPVTEKLEKRGEERYQIFCLPCHGPQAHGDGLIVAKGYKAPPSLHLERIRRFQPGRIFDYITNGIKNMPRYDHQIPVADRWAIVSYVKKLQRTHKNQK